jgi:hypothetical protein
MTSSAEDRMGRLKSLKQTLDDNNIRQDKASMMRQLSQEFNRQVQMADKSVSANDIGDAEAHRLIAESIQQILATFEAIKE